MHHLKGRKSLDAIPESWRQAIEVLVAAGAPIDDICGSGQSLLEYVADAPKIHRWLTEVLAPRTTQAALSELLEDAERVDGPRRPRV